jgi:hypothetical protein
LTQYEESGTWSSGGGGFEFGVDKAVPFQQKTARLQRPDAISTI